MTPDGKLLEPFPLGQFSHVRFEIAPPAIPEFEFRRTPMPELIGPVQRDGCGLRCLGFLTPPCLGSDGESHGHPRDRSCFEERSATHRLRLASGHTRQIARASHVAADDARNRGSAGLS